MEDRQTDRKRRLVPSFLFCFFVLLFVFLFCDNRKDAPRPIFFSMFLLIQFFGLFWLVTINCRPFFFSDVPRRRLFFSWRRRLCSSWGPGVARAAAPYRPMGRYQRVAPTDRCFSLFRGPKVDTMLVLFYLRQLGHLIQTFFWVFFS